MQNTFLSKDAFLTKHNFKLLRKGRNSLGIYVIYTSSVFRVKEYIHGNIYLSIKDLTGEYRGIKAVKELPSLGSNFHHWDIHIQETLNES